GGAAQGRGSHRTGPARLLPRQARQLQVPEAHRVPRNAAEDPGRQAAAQGRAQRFLGRRAAPDPLAPTPSSTPTRNEWTEMPRPEFAIIGTAEVPCGHYPQRNEFEIAYTVARDAVRDAGISMKQIGGVVTAAHIMGSDYNTEMFFGRLPEAIGATNCRAVATTISGGASSWSTRKTAEGMLGEGGVDYVLVLHAQRFSQFTPNQQATFFAVAGADAEWEVPYGMTYNALSAMVTQGYMNATGTTIEQVAAMCVANRRWANLQPNAMFRDKPVTVEEVLASRVVAWPLTALMCNVLADGGSAFVMTRAELAQASQKPVYFAGEA